MVLYFYPKDNTPGCTKEACSFRDNMGRLVPRGVAVLGVSNPRDRAFFAVMAQSGLRPRTLCQLRLKNLEPDFSTGQIPCRVEVPQKIIKGKNVKHFTFIGSEAVEYLRKYFLTRGQVHREHYVFTCEGTNKKMRP